MYKIKALADLIISYFLTGPSLQQPHDQKIV